MKILYLQILLIAPLLSFGQLEVTLYGDRNSQSIISKKARLEEKGFLVTVKEKQEEDDLENADPFIKTWTNKELPNFQLETMEGEILNSADLKGKKIHLNFWSTTCAPCIEEFAELNQIKEEHPDWIVIAVAPESESKVNKVFKKHPLDYIKVADAKALFEELGINGFPRNFFVNQQGIIKKVTVSTNYRLEKKNEKPVMVPDNFKVYNEIMKSI